jgi:RNA polymerase sigma factor (sigma-70 family)
MTDIPDSELISLFRKTESKNYAFNLIVRKYQERIYWHIRRMVIDHDDSDDIVQNTFIKAWEGLDNFREESKLFTWLYRIATNEALSFLKKKRRVFFLPSVDSEKVLSNTLSTDEYFDGDEARLKLQKAVLSLPEMQKMVFNMKYFDEMKYSDISEVLDVSVGALKASFHHAIKKIERYLERH